MKYIEFTHQITKGNKEACNYPVAGDDELQKFIDILSISNGIVDAVNSTEDANEFYKAYPSIKKVMNKATAVDIFYAYKLGNYFKGVPNKAVYILRRAKQEASNVKAVNTIIESCLALLKPYIQYEYVSEHGTFTLKDIIDTVFGYPVDLLTMSKLNIKIDDRMSELYVPNVDRVALIPADISLLLSFEDCLNIKYSYELGIHLSGTALRTFNGRYGILVSGSDFDLLEAY